MVEGSLSPSDLVGVSVMLLPLAFEVN